MFLRHHWEKTTAHFTQLERSPVRRIPSVREHEEDAMRKFAFVLTAAAGLATILPVTGFSAAKAEVWLEIRTDRDRYRDEYREHRRDCREVTVRERRGDEVIVRHERRCD
jgi:hypothetical protein